MAKETIKGKRPRTYDLEDRLVDFSVAVCQIVDGFPPTKIGNLVSSQLLRCSTAAAPNYGEAQSAESRRDFVHKIKICFKELRETQVWLKFASRMELVDPPETRVVIEECGQLISIFVKSIQTAQDRGD